MRRWLKARVARRRLFGLGASVAAAGGYNDGSGPGGMLINTIYSPSNADCLPNLNYIQTSAPPGLGF